SLLDTLLYLIYLENDIGNFMNKNGKFMCGMTDGCNEIQGYYFSKPLPAKQFSEFVLKEI
ncbi:MAG: hypothetical protein WC691_12830, partial [Sulfuricurvum sp.]